MDTADISDLLLRKTKDHVSARNFQLSPQSEKFFSDHATNAARELKNDPQLGDGKINAMIAVFERLADEMIASAHVNSNTISRSNAILGEDNLRRALGKLCPFFPFC